MYCCGILKIIIRVSFPRIKKISIIIITLLIKILFYELNKASRKSIIFKTLTNDIKYIIDLQKFNAIFVIYAAVSSFK